MEGGKIRIKVRIGLNKKCTSTWGGTKGARPGRGREQWVGVAKRGAQTADPTYDISHTKPYQHWPFGHGRQCHTAAVLFTPADHHLHA